MATAVSSPSGECQGHACLIVSVNRRTVLVFTVIPATARSFALAAIVMMGSAGIVSAGENRPEHSLPSGQGIAASEGIDFDTLKDDLGSTEAIDFITKLDLSGELDSLIEAFREYHEGAGDYNLAALYARFDRLLRTTLALIEHSDPPVFLKLKRSRSRLWQILIDREEFHAAMEDTDVALLRGFARRPCCR